MGKKKIKVHCSGIMSLMSNTRDNKPLTELQWDEIREYLDKEKPLTDNQVSKLKELVTKQTKYNPKTLTPAAKSDLIKMYSWSMYGMGSFFAGTADNPASEKGVIQENESIRLLSELDGIKYKKNIKKYSNEYIVGIPDIVTKVNGIRKVIDIKTPIDINTFLINCDTGLSKQYLYQMRGYLELTDSDIGEVCFCLVNAPPELIAQEIKKIKTKGYLYGWSDEKIEALVLQANHNMIFDSIPIERKVIRFSVDRDSNFMDDVYQRVLIAREWIAGIHKNHTKKCRRKN